MRHFSPAVALFRSSRYYVRGTLALAAALCVSSITEAAPADLREWIGRNNKGERTANHYVVRSHVSAGGIFQARYPYAFLADANLSNGPFGFRDALSVSGTISFSRAKVTLDPEFFFGYFDSHMPRRRLGIGAADTPDANTLRWQLQFDDGTRTVVVNLARGGTKPGNTSIPDGTYPLTFSCDGKGTIRASIGEYSTTAKSAFAHDNIFDQFGFLQLRDDNIPGTFSVTINDLAYTGQTDAEPQPPKDAVSSVTNDDVGAHRMPEAVEYAIDFRRHVLPILAQHCVRCHSSEEPNGNLVMSGREALISGGDSGPAVVPGDSSQSLLIHLVAGLDEDRIMPAEGKRLSPDQIGILRAWIDQGVTWDSGAAYQIPLAVVQLPDGDGHPIDRLLAPYLQECGISLGPVISDQRFARRLALDLIGLPLSDHQLEEFLKDRTPDKRAKLVDHLLAEHENYVAHWMSFWSDHLRIGSAIDAGIFDSDQTEAPQKWLKTQLDHDVPYDRLVRELICGEFFQQYANSIAPPGEVASQVDVPELQVAATVSQVCLGIQLKCASCHDSFVDRWTLDDAWGLASALSDEPFQIYRCEEPTGTIANPRFPLAGLGEIDLTADKQKRRRQVAEMMTDARNGLFARTIVNRLWARLFGRGLVEPRDEMMEHEAWNADLLDWLAAELVRQEYDLKGFLRLLTTSRAYQSPNVIRTHPLDPQEYEFQGPEIRRLTAEQFVDSLLLLRHAARGKSVHEETFPRAWQLDNNRLMTMLGRPGREVVVTSRDQEPTPLLVLEMINGSQLEQLVRQAAKAQLERGKPVEKIQSRIYRILLGREPTAMEQLHARQFLSLSPNLDTVTDLIWTVVMLPEFQFVP